MCSLVKCNKCLLLTWSGCGQHVQQKTNGAHVLLFVGKIASTPEISGVKW